MREAAVALIVLGLTLAGIGALLWVSSRLDWPLGRLPGDFVWRGKNWTVAVPLATCAILSLLLTILLNLLSRR